LIGADAIQRGLAEGLIAAGAIAVLATGLSLAQSGDINLLRDLPVIMAIALTSFTALTGLSNAINDFNTAMISAERVYSLMDQQPAVEDNGSARPETLKPALVFENVCFDYSANNHSENGAAGDVLNSLNFSVPAGSTLALVGESGGGKSTIVNLLMRFWDARSGTIRLGDHDIQNLALNTLRDQVAVVSQRTYIFNTTIRENIRLARPDATDQEIESAAKGARLAEFIETLPKKYDFEVGEMGARLSGGQIQRIAIARALLKDAPILVLDEATSNLDVETERDVKEAIDALSEGRTTLIIAHRLSAIVEAEEILVLKDGAIRERGRHSDLIARNGVYARLFELQQDEIDEITLEDGADK
jgi:ABC-type multidrug transport system fused ATPase/permease subunit